MLVSDCLYGELHVLSVLEYSFFPGPPTPPHQLFVKPLSSTSVLLSWAIPTHTGHSPITHYLVECKDVISDRLVRILGVCILYTSVVQLRHNGLSMPN